MFRRIELYTVMSACLLAICCEPTVGLTAPQDGGLAKKRDAGGASQANSGERYVITLSEYQLKDVAPEKLTGKNVLETIKKEKKTPAEILVLTAIADVESMVRFGRTVAVTTGRVTNRDVSQRITKDREIGTILKVLVAPRGDKVTATLSYESTRHVGEGTDDSPPDLTMTSIGTTQLLDLGQPTLVGGTSAGETSYIFLTISSR